MENLIIPQDSELNLNEIGLLSTMLNIPEYDYVTIDELCNMSSDSNQDIIQTLEKLQTKNYIIKINDIYAVNKHKLNKVIFYKGDDLNEI